MYHFSEMHGAQSSEAFTRWTHGHMQNRQSFSENVPQGHSIPSLDEFSTMMYFPREQNEHFEAPKELEEHSVHLVESSDTKMIQEDKTYTMMLEAR